MKVAHTVALYLIPLIATKIQEMKNGILPRIYRIRWQNSLNEGGKAK